MRPLDNLNFDNSFHRLGETFYTAMKPQGLQEGWLVASNPQAAKLLDWIDEQQAAHDSPTESVAIWAIITLLR